MTGYMMLHADCFLCHRLFSSNPNRVPSVNNEPICRECIEAVNRARKAKGIPAFPVPSDAYDPAEA